MNESVKADAPLRHRKVSSPVGELGLIASSRGLVRLTFDPIGVIKKLTTDELSLESDPMEDESEASDVLDTAERQLEEYFAGRRKSFSLVLDLSPILSGVRNAPNPFVSRSATFRPRAQIALLNIEYGQTASYAEVAESMGASGSARAVGTACATNPVPIFLPCHRVVRGNGKIGDYTGGVEIKRQLLDLESGNKKWS